MCLAWHSAVRETDRLAMGMLGAHGRRSPRRVAAMQLRKQDLSILLRRQLRDGVSGRELSRWAHGVYLDHSPLDDVVYEVLMALIAIEGVRSSN